MIKNSSWGESSIQKHSKKGSTVLSKSIRNPSSRFLLMTSNSSSPLARIKPYECGIYDCTPQSNCLEMQHWITLATVKTIGKICYL